MRLLLPPSRSLASSPRSLASLHPAGKTARVLAQLDRWHSGNPALLAGAPAAEEGGWVSARSALAAGSLQGWACPQALERALGSPEGRRRYEVGGGGFRHRRAERRLGAAGAGARGAAADPDPAADPAPAGPPLPRYSFAPRPLLVCPCPSSARSFLSRLSSCAAVGFDVEYCRTETGGARDLPALVALAGGGEVGLLHLHRFPGMGRGGGGKLPELGRL
ncbi:hypothetical protein TeGR_g14578, partial [Tetraparma gracilis]